MDYSIAMITIRSSRPARAPASSKSGAARISFPEDRRAIDEMVCGFPPQAPLLLAVDAHDYPQAFAHRQRPHAGAVRRPACRGTGIGAALVRHGLALHPG